MNPIQLGMPSATGMQKPVSAQAIRFAGKSADLKVASVVGTGIVNETADVMTMNITLSTEPQKDRKKAATEMSKQGEALVAELKALDLPKVKIRSSVHTSPVNDYDHQRRKHIFKGYTAALQISITEQTDKTEQLAEHAAAIAEVAVNHAADIHGPNYSLSEKKQADAQKKAMELAYRNAQAQAEEYAGLGGFAIDPVPLRVGTPAASHVGGGRMRALSAGAGLESADMGGASVSSELFQVPTITVSSQVAMDYKITGKARASRLNTQG